MKQLAAVHKYFWKYRIRLGAGIVFIFLSNYFNVLSPQVTGYVIDFVDVYWGDWHFWAFNVADAAINEAVQQLASVAVAQRKWAHLTPRAMMRDLLIMFERAGGTYYPKLQVAVPFTPVPGARLLGPATAGLT